MHEDDDKEKEIHFEDIQDKFEVLLELVVVHAGVAIQKEIENKFKRDEDQSTQRFVAVRHQSICTYPYISYFD